MSHNQASIVVAGNSASVRKYGGRMRRVLVMLTALICGTAGGSLVAQQADEKVLVIDAGLIYTMDGEPIEQGMVVVEQGKITQVGKDVTIPTGAARLSVPVLMPGLVDAYSNVGIHGGPAEITNEVTPELKIYDSIDWNSMEFHRAAVEGTTTVHLVPGSDNVFGGSTCVIKTLSEPEQRVLSSYLGSAISVCSDPASGNNSRSRPDSIYIRQPTNRMGVVWIIRSQLHRARENPEIDSASMVALRRMMNGESVFARSRTSHDLDTLIRLADEFGFQPTIVGGEEAYRVFDAISDKNYPIIYTGMATGTERGDERTELFWNTPGKLEEAGLSWCLAGGRLLEQARFAARFGASDDAALQAITSAPAAILKQSERIGKIRVGMDADFLALDGPPLEMTTARLWTMVEGEKVELK